MGGKPIQHGDDAYAFIHQLDAVGLALALSMRGQLQSCGKKRTGDLIVFHVGGFAGLTLLINATTCGALLTTLGLTKPPAVKRKLLESLQRELVEITKTLCGELIARDRRFSACKQEYIEQILCAQLGVSGDSLDTEVVSPMEAAESTDTGESPEKR